MTKNSKPALESSVGDKATMAREVEEEKRHRADSNNSIDNDGKDTDNAPNQLASLIGRCALRHYQTKISKGGKPDEDREWTVYAAIVAEKHRKKQQSLNSKLWVVSAATGTKCTANRQHGYVLHDCHAEVLSRRGLIRVLWMEIQHKLLSTTPRTKSNTNDKGEDDQESSEDLLEEVVKDDNSNHHRQYRLRSDIRLHLYISDSPCGDAR